MKIRNRRKDICPRCGEEERISAETRLKLCSSCFFAAAKKENIKHQAVSAQYDWAKTILKITRHLATTQNAIAKYFGISPAMLTLVNKGKRSIPIKVFENIKKNYSFCLTQKK